MPGEGGFQIGIQAREGAPENFFDEVEGGFDFVFHEGDEGALAGGEPKGGDFGEEGTFEGGAFAGEEAIVIEFEEEVGDPHDFGEDGTAFGFGGVGGEDEFDVEAGEEGRHLGGGDALVFEGGEGVVERVGDEGSGEVYFFFALAEAVDAFFFFGEVDKVKVEGERGGDGAGLFGVEGSDFGGEASFGVGEAGAPIFGGLPDAFFEGEEGGGFLFAEDLAEEVAKEVDGGGEGHGGRGEKRGKGEEERGRLYQEI